MNAPNKHNLNISHDTISYYQFMNASSKYQINNNNLTKERLSESHE